eukprot:3231056-Alexandrium_andersonii.AAC.1
MRRGAKGGVQEGHPNSSWRVQLHDAGRRRSWRPGRTPGTGGLEMPCGVPPRRGAPGSARGVGAIAESAQMQLGSPA